MKTLLLIGLLLGISLPISAMNVDEMKQAIEADDVDRVRHLLDVGLQTEPDFQIASLLQYVETAEMAAMLIDDYHANINKKFSVFNGDECERIVTPLHIVKTKEVAKLLLNRGADVNSERWYSIRPLHDATDIGVMRVLLEAGADANTASFHGITPIIRLLLGDPNKIDQVKLLLPVKLLLLHGADPSRQDRWGRSAINIAEKMGYTELTELFERQRKILSLLRTNKPYGLITLLRNREMYGSFRNPYKN